MGGKDRAQGLAHKVAYIRTHTCTQTHTRRLSLMLWSPPLQQNSVFSPRGRQSQNSTTFPLFSFICLLCPSLLTFHLVLYLFSSSYFISYIHPLPKLLFLPPFFLLHAYIHVFIWFLRSRGSLRSLAAVCGRTTLTSASFTPPLSPERVGRAGHSTTAVLPDVLQLFHSVVRDCSVFCKLWFALTAVGVCLEGHSYICVRKKHWRCV